MATEMMQDMGLNNGMLQESPGPAMPRPDEMPQPPQLNAPSPQSEEEKKRIDIARLVFETNIADGLDAKKLEDIGKMVFEGYQNDLKSRSEWERNYDTWIELAALVAKQKTYPWNKASNVKYPLIATAAMQFSARAYPTLIPSNGKLVNVEVIGYDKTGEKTERAEHISKHMSYQLLKKMEDWEDDMDKMFLILPIVGTCFKKTYWDPACKMNCSHLIMPKDLVVNYWSRSLENSERVTERIEMSKRCLKEKQLAKLFLDIELPSPSRTAPTPQTRTPNVIGTTVAQDDETTPYILLEQHGFYDLDDDGYPEPYIFIVEEQSKKVLRITARFETEDVETDAENNVVKIEPFHYYTKYEFIPNPDGGFYSIGFGLLLGSLNDSVNTLINQLIDAGSLQNLQAGFLGKGLRMKPGEQRFSPGEWKWVNATGDDLKKQIFPLPVQPPSDVLFNLLGTLIQSGKELASVAEIFVGKMPGQNTPATTTMATIEQGMKVFTAIYKRIYRSLTKEYKKLFKLNHLYLDYKEYENVLDIPIGPNDYDDKSYDVCPSADPAAISSTEKLIKAQGLMELLPLGTIDPVEVTRRILDAQDQPNPDALMRQGQPPADPKAQEAQMKMQLEQQKAQMEMQMKQMEMTFKQRESEQKLMMQQQMNQMKLQYEMAIKQLELKGKQAEHQFDIQSTLQGHAVDSKIAQDKMILADQQHKQAMKQTQEKEKVKPKEKTKE